MSQERENRKDGKDEGGSALFLTHHSSHCLPRDGLYLGGRGTINRRLEVLTLFYIKTSNIKWIRVYKALSGCFVWFCCQKKLASCNQSSINLKKGFTHHYKRHFYNDKNILKCLNDKIYNGKNVFCFLCPV